VTRFRPADERALMETIGSAVAADEPLELLAGGSKRGLGRPMQAPHQLDLGAFSGIRQYEPEELVLSAGAATPLGEIERALAEVGQMLAFEPGDWRALLGTETAEPTLGGALLCNLSGPRRIRQGAARDHFLGLKGVSGRGEAFKAGGRVVKNVTGYDLCKLMAGSYGTLAALTEVTVKVLPRPEATRTLVLEGLDDAAALRALTQALGSADEPSGAAHWPAEVASGGKAMTLLRLEGPIPSVEARSRSLSAELAGFGAAEILDDSASLGLWRSVRDAAVLARPEDRELVLWRVSLVPSAAAEFVAELRRKLDIRYFFDWGGGLVWLAVANAEDGGARVLRGALAAGHATLIRAPGTLRAAVPVFQPQPREVAALTQRVKDGFDPKRILNRGRMYAGL
jgi:glycolate dehydrogenase FAD-binding subunit